MRTGIFLFLITVTILITASCNKNESEPEKGIIEIHFTHSVDGKPVQFDQLIYTNTAGNQFMITDIKYFISRLIFINEEGKSVVITQDEGIHYVDCDLGKTLRWKIGTMPDGNYTAISFVFGLDEEDNISNRFVNPPESNFSWPNYMGGGYHYMQINGRFLNKEGKITNMNIHTGIGQIYNGNNEVTEFVQNFFTVNLPVKFSINEDNTTILTIDMEILRWFDTPNVYNFDEYGTAIMQNQHAQQMLKENGGNVFVEIMKYEVRSKKYEEYLPRWRGTKGVNKK
ncbi:MAG: hypothetical protein LBU83_09305 [Bacteroidales bacterium]|jgi:hypothetical protein|nr:hypothetical protein [Bacteroidales bacterium]